MAFNFPASPSVNDTYVSGGITYTWDGTTWKASNTFTETDPVFVASAASGISSTNISNWNTAYGWGDHSTEGYLTSLGDAAGVTTAKIVNWDTAYGWGDHSAAGYQRTSQLNSAIDSHLNQSDPTSGYILSWNGSDYAWVAPPSGATLQPRSSAQATTNAIANNVSDYITITAAKTYVLQKIQTSAAAWVTVYTDMTSRFNDATRNETTDPLPGSGVVAEVITTGASTQKITPGTIGWNDDDVSPSSNVYLKVVNKSGINQAITVTLTYVQLEA